MSTEYKLSYTASEINKRLGKIVDADQIFNPDSLNAQSGKALKDIVAKEVWITIDEVGNPVYLQDFDAGVYIFRTEDSTNPDIYHTLIAGDNSYDIGANSILIVTGDSILKHTSMPDTGVLDIMKHFILIYEVPYSYYTEVVDGSIWCNATDDGNGGLTWEIYQGDATIVTSNSVKNRIDDNQLNNLNIPTINAVQEYVASSGAKLSNRKYKTVADYTVTEDGITEYVYRSANTNEDLDSAMVYMFVPKIDTVNKYTLRFLMQDSTTGKGHGRADYEIGESVTTDILGGGRVMLAKIDAIVNGYNFLSQCGDDDKSISESKVFPIYYNYQPEVDNLDYRMINGIYNISIRDTDGKNLPVGTHIKVLGVAKK